MKNEKPILSIDDQIDLYRTRGLIIDDVDSAKRYLAEVGYYRLSIYAKYYRLSIYAKYFQEDDMYQIGTTFTNISSLYEFDKELRTLLLKYLEIIENSFKTAMIRQLGNIHGSFWHTKMELFDCEGKDECSIVVQKFLQGIIDAKKNTNPDSDQRYNGLVLNHYYNTYTEPPLPPIWMMVHIMSFGEIIKLYRYLMPKYKIIISNHYDVDGKTLKGWLYCLSNLRNMCAHGERIWNNIFTSATKIPKELIGGKNYRRLFAGPRRKIYDYLIVVLIIMKQINCKNNLMEELLKLAQKYNIDQEQMGFSANSIQEMITHQLIDSDFLLKKQEAQGLALTSGFFADLAHEPDLYEDCR